MKFKKPTTITIPPTVDSQIDVNWNLTQVESRSIKEDISSDFVLAHLNDQDREGVIEITVDAYLAYRAYFKLKTWLKDTWNPIKKQWEKTPLSEEEQKYIQKMAEATFDSYMKKPYMTVTLNRNKKDNFFAKILTQFQEQNELIEEEPLNKETLQALKEKLSNKEKWIIPKYSE